MQDSPGPLMRIATKSPAVWEAASASFVAALKSPAFQEVSRRPGWRPEVSADAERHANPSNVAIQAANLMRRDLRRSITHERAGPWRNRGTAGDPENDPGAVGTRR